MLFSPVDTIVRRWLLERGLPLHWYVEGLVHCTAGLRQLTFSTLKMVNTVPLKLNEYFACDLPGDFVDDVAVCIPVGGLLQNIPKNDAITPLRNVDSDGQFVPFTSSTNAENASLYGISASWLWFWNVNDWGEPTGRYFGAGGGSHRNGYKLIKERRQIQLTETFTSDEIVLVYISNGQSADNATQVDSQAQMSLQSWMDWKTSPNAAIKDSYEAATFYNERRLLVAALNDMTTTDVVNIIRRNYMAAIKN